jgi:hypothetical protein
MPTVLIFTRLAGIDTFIKHASFFSDQEWYASSIKEFQDDSFMHNQVCLASGKVLGSPGLFASKHQYDAFLRPSPKMNSVLRFIVEHLKSWNAKEILTDAHYKNLQENIIKFCKNSIEGKSFNGHFYSNEDAEGFYPCVHGSTVKKLLDEFRNDFNVDGSNDSDLLGYVYSKSSNPKWCFDILDKDEVLTRILSQKERIKSSEPDSEADYANTIKMKLQIKDFIDTAIAREAKFSKPPVGDG